MNPFPIPNPPETVTAAAADLAKIRAALARQAQADEANKAQLAAEKAAHTRLASDAALEGTPPPKVSAALKSLRENVESSADTLADLLAREEVARSAHMGAVNGWGKSLVAAQIAEDAKRGREALADFADATRRLFDALGDDGRYLAERVFEYLPAEVRFARFERLNAFNGIFSSVDCRNPAQHNGAGMLIEAGCPTAEDARRLVETPPPVLA